MMMPLLLLSSHSSNAPSDLWFSAHREWGILQFSTLLAMSYRSARPLVPQLIKYIRYRVIARCVSSCFIRKSRKMTKTRTINASPTYLLAVSVSTCPHLDRNPWLSVFIDWGAPHTKIKTSQQHSVLFVVVSPQNWDNSDFHLNQHSQRLYRFTNLTKDYSAPRRALSSLVPNTNGSSSAVFQLSLLLLLLSNFQDVFQFAQLSQTFQNFKIHHLQRFLIAWSKYYHFIDK